MLQAHLNKNTTFNYPELSNRTKKELRKVNQNNIKLTDEWAFDLKQILMETTSSKKNQKYKI